MKICAFLPKSRKQAKAVLKVAISAVLPIHLAVAQVAYAQCGPDSFANAGYLYVARADAQGTALSDGSAIIVGGAYSTNDNMKAETYHPNTGSYTQVAFSDNLNNTTVTSMNNGTVVMSGGDGAGSIYTSPKILFYRPSDGTSYSLTMLQSRRFHTVTQLNTGKLLIVGGETRFLAGYELATAELYDPSTGTFSYTGSMAYVRKNHTATVLQSGKVLVVSGTSAELYNPATGQFATVVSPTYPRKGHTATLLNDGRVLLAGGYQSSGTSYGNSEAELFDPYSNTFSRLPSNGLGVLNTPRVAHTATLLPNGKVILVGGHDQKNASDRYYTRNANTTELFDPTTNKFTWGPTLTRRRSGHVTVLLNDGRLWIGGGYGFLQESGVWNWYYRQTGAELSGAGYCTGGTSLGCYNDDANRALPVLLKPNGATVDTCIAMARTRGYPYVGLQNGGACYAGFAPAYSYDAVQTDCNMACTANVAQSCGGAWHNNIWSTGLALPTIPWSRRVGCYYDDSNRDLDALLIDGGATVETCVAAAGSRGFAYAALQNGGRCFAGNSVTYAATPNDCTMRCAANPAEYCGNIMRNEIYTTLASAPSVTRTGKGCFNDDANRALPARLIGAGATVESCTAAAKALGYTYAGLQWYGQCWAGQVLGYGPSNGSCTTKCTANGGQDCGGNYANNVFLVQ